MCVDDARRQTSVQTRCMMLSCRRPVTIDDAGIADNTIVIFTGDNGHSHYTDWRQLVDAGQGPSQK